jgi:LysR family transcriptional activator of glutamate synthase operon
MNIDKQFDLHYYLFCTGINGNIVNINHLREFIALAQTRNFLEAADVVYSSQSTLSKHIKSLEKEMGVPLFDRTTRKVVINKYGQRLLPIARQIVELEDHYLTTLRGQLKNEKETLTVGSIHVLAQYHITDIFADFKKICPQATINVVQGGSDEMKEMLRNKSCDLAFIRYAQDADDDFVKIPYASDTMVAVLPTDHPLADRKVISLPMLANEDILLTAKQTMLYKLSIQACEKSGFSPKVAYTDHDVGGLLDMVSRRVGIALLMKQIAIHALDQKLAIVDITPGVTTQINLCYLKEAKLSALGKQFLICAEDRRNDPNLLNPPATKKKEI